MNWSRVIWFKFPPNIRIVDLHQITPHTLNLVLFWAPHIIKHGFHIGQPQLCLSLFLQLSIKSLRVVLPKIPQMFSFSRKLIWYSLWLLYIWSLCRGNYWCRRSYWCRLVMSHSSSNKLCKSLLQWVDKAAQSVWVTGAAGTCWSAWLATGWLRPAPLPRPLRLPLRALFGRMFHIMHQKSF